MKTTYDVSMKIPSDILRLIFNFVHLVTVKNFLILNKKIYALFINDPQFKLYNEYLKKYELTQYDLLKYADLTIIEYYIRYRSASDVEFIYYLSHTYNIRREVKKYIEKAYKDPKRRVLDEYDFESPIMDKDDFCIRDINRYTGHMEMVKYLVTIGNELLEKVNNDQHSNNNTRIERRDNTQSVKPLRIPSEAGQLHRQLMKNSNNGKRLANKGLRRRGNNKKW